MPVMSSVHDKFGTRIILLDHDFFWSPLGTTSADMAPLYFMTNKSCSCDQGTKVKTFFYLLTYSLSALNTHGGSLKSASTAKSSRVPIWYLPDGFCQQIINHILRRAINLDHQTATAPLDFLSCLFSDQSTSEIPTKPFRRLLPLRRNQSHVSTRYRTTQLSSGQTF